MARINYIEQDKTLNPESRYRKFRLVEDEDGQISYETPDPLVIQETTDDYFYSVERSTLRLDLIADKFYGNPRLGWVIAIYNDLEDLVSLEVGQVLRIPSLSVLFGFRGVLS